MVPVSPSPALAGLDAQQVEQSLHAHGSNALTQQKKSSFFSRFLCNFGDPVIKVLLIALAINVVFMFRNANWFETAGIAVAIFLATFVSTLSEYGSESAFTKLQEDAGKIECRVRRAGSLCSLPITELVVGDIVLLQAGERVPADGLLLAGALYVDQSALNGESKEVEKRPQPLSTDKWDLSHKNQLFRGSVIASGEGILCVQRVGDKTFYGDMARQMQEETRESPLKLRLGKLAESISRLGYIAAFLVAVADLFHSLILDNGMHLAGILASFTNWPVLFGHLLHAITLAITVVVVAVPEGLPMMITVVLSSNMLRMLRDHVLVRKLVGIETSGSLNILFTDKTGTLTRGKLQVTSFLAGDGKEYDTIEKLRRTKDLFRRVELSCFYNTESAVSKKKALGGNATDRALLDYILPVSKEVQGISAEMTSPFDSAKKYSAAKVHCDGETFFVKGAPEKLLPLCTSYYSTAAVPLPLQNKAALEAKIKQMTQDAQRVIALCASKVPVDRMHPPSELILIGLISIRDQIRPEARRAVEQVQHAGIQVVMITGDNALTARTIASQAGLLQGAGEDAILTSGELAKLTDAQLKSRMKTLRVIARALPSDKTRLVRLAQECGLVAGMTGDGINDAPALKKADVGFSMGSGTEVAKEAGDIVILDDNFSSIAKAVLYGRTIFKSIRKFIVFQLTMNLCAVGVSIIGPLIGIDSPVTIVQMLWINMIMDTLGGLAFAGEPPLKDYMREAPKDREEPLLNRYMVNQTVCMGLFTVLLCVLFLKSDTMRTMFCYETEPVRFLTAFFTLFVFCGVLNSFNTRTHRLNLLSHLWRNPAFLVIMTAVTIIQVVFIYYGGSLFRTTGLTAQELLTVLALAALVIPADFVRKLLLRIMHRSQDF